jgi:hypothetical protein
LQIASRDRLPLGAPQPCVAISNDGRLVVAVVERDDTTFLFRRFLDEPDGKLLEDSRGAYHPSISPNGEWVSFLTGNSLMRISARGERATRLLELPNSFGHCWINDSEIVINRSEGRELLRVDVERGTFTKIQGGSAHDRFMWPSRVPGMEAVLFNSDSFVAKSEETESDQVSLMSFDPASRTVLGISGSMPRATPSGQILLVRDGMLAAASFDPQDPGRQVRPVAALEGLLVEGWLGQYAVSDTGTLVYVPGEWLLGTELVWDDGGGNVVALGFPLLPYGDFEISPDGTQLALTVGGANDSRSWIYDLERGARRLLTTDDEGAFAIWSPDGTRLAFGSSRGGTYGLYLRTLGSNAPAELILQSEHKMIPYTWHEAVGVLYSVSFDIFRIDPDNPNEPEAIVATDAAEWSPDISPDGRWIAYTSDESGRYEIYARALDNDRSWTVSLDGGEEPIWSEDGKTIYYRNGNGFLATPVLEASADRTRFRVGRPVVVVEGAYANVPGLSYDVHPGDGRT